MTDYIQNLTCPNCKDTDLVFSSKAKEWICPFCFHDPIILKEIKEKIEGQPTISITKWKKVTDEMPKYNEIVWGWWKNREVCLVQHSMSTDQEYYKYCEDGIWYSLDDEKTGCVSYWMPLERPENPNE